MYPSSPPRRQRTSFPLSVLALVAVLLGASPTASAAPFAPVATHLAGGDVAVSRDGTVVSFRGKPDRRTRYPLIVRNLQTGRLRTLSQTLYANGSQALASDGKAVAYSPDPVGLIGRVVVQSVTGRVQRTFAGYILVGATPSLRWALVHKTQRGRVVGAGVLDLRDGHYSAVPGAPRHYSLIPSDAQISDDGSRVLYLANSATRGARWLTFNLKTRKAGRLTAESLESCCASATSDLGRVLIPSQPARLFDLSTSASTELPPEAAAAAIARNGRRIVIQCLRAIYALDDGVYREVAPNPIRARDGLPTPVELHLTDDGRSVFVSNLFNGPALYKATVNDSSPGSTTVPPDCESPTS